MLIGIKRKFVFIANLKTASTAIEAALLPFSDIALITSEEDKHLPFRDIEERFGDILDELDRKELLIFGVMRSPVDFCLSLYNSHASDKFKLSPRLYTRDINFDHFIKVWTQNNSDQVKPQFTRFLDRTGEIAANYIISYENLLEGLKYVASVIDVPPLLKLDRENVSEQRLRRDDLSEEQLAWIFHRFKEDEQFATRFCDRRLGENLVTTEYMGSLAATGDIASTAPQYPGISNASTTMTRRVSAYLVDTASSGLLDVPDRIRPDMCLIESVNASTLKGDAATTAAGDAASVERAVSVATQISTDELITAAYKAVLGRPADPSGLQTYGRLFRDVLVSEAVERMVLSLLESQEFRTKRAVAGEASNSRLDPANTCSFTPEEAQWVSSLGIRLDRVLVARFRPDPGSPPMIHLRDRSLSTVYRVLEGRRYIETLISGYLLHPDYYYMNFASAASFDRELICICQLDDQTVDVDKTFGYCGKGSKLTLIPDLHFWLSKGYFHQRQEFNKSWLRWEDRVPRVFWRGSSTGAELITLDSLRQLPRFRLCATGAGNMRLPGILDAKLTNIVQSGNAEEAGKIRAYVDSLGLLAVHVPQAEFLRYRFQIDIDGNSNSWSFLPKLMMGSCVLKVMSEWRQWYYDDLRPWEHYVPVKNDLSDLEEQVAWCLDNDDDAREIGTNGMKYANGIVFGTEMLKAAGSVIRASRETLAVPS